MDSLKPSRAQEYRTLIPQYLARYVEQAWNDKSQGRPICLSKVPSYDVNVPRQRNGFDCGGFMLRYIENFINQQSPFVPTDSYKRWFPQGDGESMRVHIQAVISVLVQPAASIGEHDEEPESDVSAQFDPIEEEEDVPAELLNPWLAEDAVPPEAGSMVCIINKRKFWLGKVLAKKNDTHITLQWYSHPSRDMASSEPWYPSWRIKRSGVDRLVHCLQGNWTEQLKEECQGEYAEDVLLDSVIARNFHLDAQSRIPKDVLKAAKFRAAHINKSAKVVTTTSLDTSMLMIV